MVEHLCDTQRILKLSDDIYLVLAECSNKTSNHDRSKTWVKVISTHAPLKPHSFLESIMHQLGAEGIQGVPITNRLRTSQNVYFFSKKSGLKREIVLPPC